MRRRRRGRERRRIRRRKIRRRGDHCDEYILAGACASTHSTVLSARRAPPSLHLKMYACPSAMPALATSRCVLTAVTKRSAPTQGLAAAAPAAGYSCVRVSPSFFSAAAAAAAGQGLEPAPSATPAAAAPSPPLDRWEPPRPRHAPRHIPSPWRRRCDLAAVTAAASPDEDLGREPLRLRVDFRRVQELQRHTLPAAPAAALAPPPPPRIVLPSGSRDDGAGARGCLRQTAV
eukprot:COSAG01_NODE_1285_length_10901_cov_5.922514_10_plen_232_part_00